MNLPLWNENGVDKRNHRRQASSCLGRRQDLPRSHLPCVTLAERHRSVAKLNTLIALFGQLEANLPTGDQVLRRTLDALLDDALGPGEIRMGEQPERVAPHD